MLVALALILAATDTPRPAVPGPVEHLKEVVVEAIRNCPKSEGDEIVVCARDRGVAEGYRLPKIDPRLAAAADAAHGRLDTLAGVGASGQGSCSATGAAGATGCSLAEARSWGAQKKEDRKNGRWFPW